MKIYKIEPHCFACNCYLVTADGKSAVAIDPGEESVISEAKGLGLEIKAVLLTHGHFDHIGGCNRLYADGVPIYCGREEKAVLSGEGSLCARFGAPMPEFQIKSTLCDGEEIELCGVRFCAIATPGHTVGGMSYLTDNALFTGDTLFCGGVGRTDFPTGDGTALYHSVKKLYTLAPTADFYPGHGENGKIEEERKGNPFVREE